MQQSIGVATQNGSAEHERLSAAEYGSDIVIELLQELGVPYVSLNPGASFRGLHDSLVNFGDGTGPRLILCCHEEIAVALACGYARATGRALGVMLHNVVGLQHATMAIFNAWCDRLPVIVMGGTGPMDATKRRPYIDWVHTALVQGNQVRDYVKWDDQPGSVEAIPESVLRGYRIATTEPQGPVYLCFDSDLQEQKIEARLPMPEVKRFAAPATPAANSAALRAAAAALVQARWPVIIADAMGRHHEALPALVELAELLGAAVIDAGEYYNFPSTHALDATLAPSEAIERADVVLGLDAFDLGRASTGIGHRNSRQASPVAHATVIHITLGDLLQHGWAADYERLHPVDIPIAADTAQALPELVALCRAALAGDPSSDERIASRRQEVQRLHESSREQALLGLQGNWENRPISSFRLYRELWSLIEGSAWTLASAAGQVPLRALWDITEPEQLARSGRGAGVGYSVCASLGVALACKESGRFCVSVLGDGEVLMNPSSLWTAAAQQLPELFVVFNNRSYYQDEGHQELMARTRGRSMENKGIGLRLTSPEPDFATLARAYGVQAFGPVTDPGELHATLERALSVVREQRMPALVDVITQPR